MRLFGRSKTEVEERSASFSVGDPAYAAYFGLGLKNFTGVQITEYSAMSISAVWRAVSLISQTIASLPASAIEETEDGQRIKYASWIDQPSRNGITSFEFWETVVVHLLLHGNAFCLKVRNGAGVVVGLIAIHPGCISVEYELNTFIKTFTVSVQGKETVTYSEEEILHIPALSTSGLRGLGPLQIASNSLGIAIAADRAAGKMFESGAHISGIVTPEEDVTEEEVKKIKEGLNANVAGWDNAGEIAVVNRKLKFTPWTMSNLDAEFMASRQFQVEEIARWFGVPPYELMQTEKQTSWGTGIEAQQRGLARQVLGPWVRRLEERISSLLPEGRKIEFDFSALERPTPEVEIDLLIKQVAGGLMTVNEARAIRNLPPVEGGESLGAPSEPTERPDSDPDQ